VALPILNVTVAANGVDCVQPYCSFTAPGGETISFQNAQVSGSATGIGDVVLRAKASVLESERFKLAVGCDVRVPSGDALNFLGSGSVGVKPFEAVSRSGRFSPHLNVAYQWNGDSLLAGAVPGEKGNMPEILSYAVGADMAAAKDLTVSADFLGEHVLNAARLAQVTTLGLPNTALAVGNFDTARGALGFKWKPVKDMLVSGNILAKFDHNGLHHTPVPLVGISYTF
jgi:Putative MetA-pathway of phenol degradation